METPTAVIAHRNGYREIAAGAIVTSDLLNACDRTCPGSTTSRDVVASRPEEREARYCSSSSKIHGDNWWYMLARAELSCLVNEITCLVQFMSQL